jgi:DNA-binding NarL/FixJ family response regulator
VKPKIKLLLIEDNRFLREGIAAVLTGHGGFDVDTVVDCDDFLARVSTLSAPDVVLLDLSLEATSTTSFIATLRDHFPASRLVAMDIMPDDADIAGFVQSGGCGFILKNATVDEYINTIESVANGATVLPTVLTKSLFAQIAESSVRRTDKDSEEGTRLTAREAEIAELISMGMSNRDIAKRLHIATFTVKSHVHNILDKLELKSRLQIAVFVHRDQH